MASIGTAPRLDGTTSADTLTGSETLKNVIYGGAGDDTITGGTQADVLVGDAGNDTVRGGAGNDSLWGGGGDDKLYGDAGSDYLVGDGGDDVLDGGTGADTMIGGVGNDTYIVDDVADVVVEKAAEGIDTVYASVDYVLPDNVEHLFLTKTESARATGNALDNTLTGNSGDNVLDGAAGADTMAGGAGNDTYVVDNVGDKVIEVGGAGIDTVQASITHTLGANVENLTLTGSAAINGTGNALDNTIAGNGGANVIDGGAGNDILDGGAGNDTLYGGTGADALQGGVGDDKLDGQAGTDILYGGEGNDFLNGGADGDILFGGIGNDGFFGGGGNDRIYGGDGNDRIYGDGGNDLIQGGAGDDIMTGGTINGAGVKGADTFAWDRADVVDANGRAAGRDHITDFSLGAGDKLDFTGLFGNAHPANLAPLLHVTDTAGGTVISADIGGGTFIDVVVLDNVHVTLDDLVHSHAIVV